MLFGGQILGEARPLVETLPALSKTKRALLALNRVRQPNEVLETSLIAADDRPLLALERKPQRGKLAKGDRIGRAELGGDSCRTMS